MAQVSPLAQFWCKFDHVPLTLTEECAFTDSLPKYHKWQPFFSNDGAEGIVTDGDEQTSVIIHTNDSNKVQTSPWGLWFGKQHWQSSAKRKRTHQTSDHQTGISRGLKRTVRNSKSVTSLTSAELPVGCEQRPTYTQMQLAWEMQGRKKTPVVCTHFVPRTLLLLSSLHPSHPDPAGRWWPRETWRVIPKDDIELNRY